MSKIRKWVQLIRDIGLIIGVPVIISVGISLHNEQIDSLKAQLALAESTRFDNVLNIVESQKALYAFEKEAIRQEISQLSLEKQELASECLALEKEMQRTILGATILSGLVRILLELESTAGNSIQPDTGTSAD